MRIISIKTIKDFWESKRYKDSEQSLRAWYHEVKKEKWKTSHDIKKKYKSASILSNERVVFNIKGNQYRLIVAVNYILQIVFIRFIGTHEEYNKINAKEI
jgi:mRNA interferase HigB